MIDRDSDNPRADPPELHGFVRATGDVGDFVFNVPRPPITYEDLVRVFEKQYPRDESEEMARDLESAPAVAFWSADVLFGVAELSSEHMQRIRQYLGWSDAKLSQEIAAFRNDPEQYIKRNGGASMPPREPDG